MTKSADFGDTGAALQAQAAKPVLAATAQSPAHHAIRFSIGANQCIDQSGCIVEVLTPAAITCVPGSAPWFKGISTYRGDAIAVSDLGTWCGYAPSLDSASARLLILEADSDYFGLLVDSVQALYTGEEQRSSMTATRAFSSRNSRLGQLVIGSITEHDRVVLVLDLQKLARLDTFLDINTGARG